MSRKFNLICVMALAAFFSPPAQAQSAMTAYVPEFNTTLHQFFMYRGPYYQKMQHLVSILCSERKLDLSRIPANVRADIQLFYREKKVVLLVYERANNEYNRLFESVKSSYYFNVAHGLPVPGYLYSDDWALLPPQLERLYPALRRAAELRDILHEIYNDYKELEKVLESHIPSK